MWVEVVESETRIISRYYEPFDFTYEFEVNDSCSIVNGSEVIASEIERSMFWIQEQDSPFAAAFDFFTPQVGAGDVWRRWVESTVAPEMGCATIYYLVGGRRVDVSGVQNINFGFYTEWMPRFLVMRVGDVAALVHLRLVDEPDDRSQILLGRQMGLEISLQASPLPDYIDDLGARLLIDSP